MNREGDSRSELPQILTSYDQAAQEMLEVARSEGYFDHWDPAQLQWPPSRPQLDPGALPALERRAELVNIIYQGVPPRRDHRLADAYQQFSSVSQAYYQGSQIYLQVKKQFMASGAGTAQDLLQLYQALYLEELAKEDLFVPDAGEAALERARISRVPLSRAQSVAEHLAAAITSDDPRWSTLYFCTIAGVTTSAPLGEWLRQVAQRTLDYLAAGELLATRFNTYSNFAWFGSSIWKVITDAELLLCRLKPQRLPQRPLDRLEAEIRQAQRLLVEFIQAHRESPAQLKPTGYWYGHQYSYLTRDLIDLTLRLIGHANDLVRPLKRSASSPALPELVVPPVLTSRASGRFLEYPQVGRAKEFSHWQRLWRLGRWVLLSWQMGRRKLQLAKSSLEAEQRRELAWQSNTQWAMATLRVFNIQVKVRIDPQLFPIAQELGLGKRKNKILFLPTHQSLLDHPVMYQVMQSPELLAALGWQEPVPWVVLARTGLASAGVRLGSRFITMFGVSKATFDHLLQEVDGYVMLERTADTSHAVSKLVQGLETRPGLTYPTGTIVAFNAQSPPLQHALFAQLPQDVVIIPMALRGIHALWPKCPKGNLHLNPGYVEVMVSPPILGETTLLPRRRSLRTQLEAAALVQAIHITSLLNPDPSHEQAS